MIDMLLFAMGRYLNLASSRGDLALPSNLQGIWANQKPAMELRLPRQHQPPDELLGCGKHQHLLSPHALPQLPQKMAATQ